MEQAWIKAEDEAACVEATRRCVRMFRLKNMSWETTVTVRDREVRRDGDIFARRVGV